MRFVLCDDDQLFTSMVEIMLGDLGHEVVGVATSTADSVALVGAARPDVVIVDLSLGFNTDFDIVTAAVAVGATTIVFSGNADEAIISQYAVRPTVVFKPDIIELERVVTRLGVDSADRVVAHDRRVHEARAAGGPVPTSVSDAQAFYEALNEATAGDVLASIELPEGLGLDAAEIATAVRAVEREADRVLASPALVRIYLPGAGEVGISTFRERLAGIAAVPGEAVVRSVVIGPGESPADAFDRLKHASG